MEPQTTAPVSVKRRKGSEALLFIIIFIIVVALAWLFYRSHSSENANLPPTDAQLQAIRDQMNAASPAVPAPTDAQLSTTRTEMSAASPASTSSTPSDQDLANIRAQMDAASASH